MVRKGLCVPEVDARQEVTLLARSELLENLVDVDVRHVAGLEKKWAEDSYGLLHTGELSEAGQCKGRKGIQIEPPTD